MRMNRITTHHSGGSYQPSSLDLSHYHRGVTGDGEVVSGKFDILANAPTRALREGTYAAHTRGLNSGNIGLCAFSMGNAQWSNPRGSRLFPTLSQIEALCKEAARLCLEWGIPAERETLLSHAEVEITLGVKQRGKWDFDYSLLGRVTSRDPVAVGDEWRQEVRRYIGRPVQPAPVVDSIPPTLRRGDRGADVGRLQRLLRMSVVDMVFGPMTFASVVSFQKTNQLRPDGVVGPMTWAALQRQT